MNDEDIALFRQAEQLANSRQFQAAHQMFCELGYRNPEQIEVLFWIATTSNDPMKAGQAITAIRRLQPDHPRLKELETFHRHRLQIPSVPIIPVLLCPYCGTRAPALVRSKTSTAGIITLIVVLIICFPLFWVGLLIQEKYYVCSHCGSQIAMMR